MEIITMPMLSTEDMISYQIFTHSNNFPTLLKKAIDKYCTDIDKITELQQFLLQKPKELIERREKSDRSITIALAIGASALVENCKKQKHINRHQFVHALCLCHSLLPEGLKNIKNASGVEKELINLLSHCLINKHHFDYEDPHDVMWAMSYDHWNYICGILKEQGIDII